MPLWAIKKCCISPITSCKQEKVSLRINFGIYYELRQEILSHGANVEVVYPKTLRAQINEEIAEMHK